MEAVSSGQARRPDRLWRAWHVPAFDWRVIQPHCLIDHVNYGCGTLRFRVSPTGATREYGLRPLWPDEAKLRDFRSFYDQLEASVRDRGVVVPILLYQTAPDKFYVRYGASRIWIARKLDLPALPAVVCSWDQPPLEGGTELVTPLDILRVLKADRVGEFEASHERLDFHRIEPYGFSGLT